MKNICTGFSRHCPVKEILDLTFIPGHNLLIFSFSKTIPVQQKGEIDLREIDPMWTRRDRQDKAGDPCSAPKPL